jgi:hypothetical protein
MKKRRAIRDVSMLPDELGQDSFLDTIANLVGVLIILVMVVGAHARKLSVADHACATEKSQLETLREEVGKSQATEQNVRSDYEALQRQIAAEEELLQVKSLARTQILTALTEAERELDQRQATIDQAKLDTISRQLQWRELQQYLSDVERRTAAAMTAEPSTKAIEHLPTPIAKTVFRDDVHFRLKAGRLAYVPMEGLVQQMRNEMELKAEKLATTPRIVEMVGPLDGFRLQYELVARRVTQQTQVGPVTGRSIELDHFSIQPLGENIGEPLEAALEAGSAFQARLASLQPERHTISVWVYPDSFAEFNRFKRWLYDRGFQTAAWPLSNGALISGGPNGFRATAQ